LRRTRSAIAIAGIATVLLAGCSPEAAQGSGLTRVTVGVLPGADVAPLFVAVQEGLFAEQGIDLTIDSLAASSADIINAVDEGRYDFGYADMISILAAQEGGAQLQIVSGAAATSGDSRSDYAGIMSQASDITSVADLEGRTVAIDAAGTTNEAVVRAAIDAAGVDSSTISFEAIPFINMRKAIAGGNVDAALVVEPYLTSARLAGMPLIAHPYAEFDENLTVSGYFASQSIVSENPELVKSFVAALAASFEHAEAAEGAVRTNISTYLASDAQVRTRLILPAFSTAIDRDAAQALAEAAHGYGLLSSVPDLDEVLPAQ
jgi:NitT/TauT family transport system substrate-binding protein